MNDLQLRDRIIVLRESEEIEVFNHATVEQPMYFRSGGVEKFPPKVAAGNNSSNSTPKAITHWLADLLESEGVLVPDETEVVDVTDDDVEVV